MNKKDKERRDEECLQEFSHMYGRKCRTWADVFRAMEEIDPD